VAEKRRTARQAVTVKRGIGMLGAVAVVIGIVAVLVIAGVIVYQSNLFQIEEVRVDGATHLTAEHLTELAAIPAGSTLLRVDTGGIIGRLQSDPWVAEARIERSFPATLVLAIEERPITAKVQVYENSTGTEVKEWLISGDGMWLAQVGQTGRGAAAISAEQVAALPVIKDISRTVVPEVGKKATDEGVLNALAIVTGMSPAMVEQISSITAPDAVKTLLTLKNNVGVAFGVAEDIPAKEAAITTLLAQHKDTITYINVRVPDRATYRAAE
jgi:cell division protein FtsQ